MGAVADELADRIIVTDDNPRSEDPPAITAASRSASNRMRRGSFTIAARPSPRRSTRRPPKTSCLIAGKGHEDYQIYGDVRRRFSDRQAEACGT
jgi:UDP-N-acetylmuramoyl-L-alanyl-D-glutamate--2,6-diaminopimelate ligase